MSTTLNCEQSTSRTRAISRYVESLQPELATTCPWADTKATVIDGPNVREIYATAAPCATPDGSIAEPSDLASQTAETFDRLAELLSRCDASVDDLVTIDLYFECPEGQQKAVKQLVDSVVPEAYPRQVLLAPPVVPGVKVSAQVYAVRPHKGVSFQRREVSIDPRTDIWGAELQYGGFRHYYVSGISGAGAAKDDLGASANLMWKRVHKALTQEDFSIFDVPRTHIYYDGPYQDLRDSRHKYFAKMNVTDDDHPSSTGIPTKPLAGRSVMRLHAVQATGDIPLVNRRVDPTTQSQAFDYGSLFARARWVETDVAKLEIAGTAAMGRNGKVIYQGRPKEQAMKTRENVMDLVDLCGLTADDLVRHIVYVCYPRHLTPWWDNIREKNDLTTVPGVMTSVQAAICWGQLTIEEEATAISLRIPGNAG